MVKFGKWHFDEDEGTVWLIDDDGGHSTEICEVSADNVGPLLAAAPALLAACQKLRSCKELPINSEFLDSISEALDGIDAAIAAALPAPAKGGK
jgi:hypothetical protein